MGSQRKLYTRIGGSTGGYSALPLSFSDHFDSLSSDSLSSHNRVSPAIESKSEFPQFLGALLIQYCWVADFSLPFEEQWWDDFGGSQDAEAMDMLKAPTWVF
jgi:hypothetical protein